MDWFIGIRSLTRRSTICVCRPRSETQAVIYALAAQNLPEQSALDAEYLIKEVQPEAVVVQIAPSALSQIQAEENDLSDDKEEIPIPTSGFGVLKRCFISKTGRQQYENIAGGQVLRDIFGVGFYGHFLSAKGAANKEVNVTFLYLESSCVVTTCVDSREEADIGNSDTAHVLQPSNLLPGNVTPAISLSASRLYLNNELQFQMVKLLSSSLPLSLSNDPKRRSVSVGN